MVLKACEDVIIAASVAWIARALANQATEILEQEPVTWGIQTVIKELKGLDQVTSMVAGGALAYQGTGFVAAAMAQQVQGPFAWAKPLLQKGISIFQIVLKTWIPWKKITKETGEAIVGGEWTINVLWHLALDHPIADDLIWGGVRGLITGACTGASMGKEDWKTQMALGAITGIGYGVASSAVGSLAGKTVRCVFKMFGHTIEDRTLRRCVGVGVIFLGTSPSVQRSLLTYREQVCLQIRDILVK